LTEAADDRIIHPIHPLYMDMLLTTREFALAIGVSESSLRRWTDRGMIGTTRTVGGHRRIPLPEALRFIRESRTTVMRPDLLGLAPAQAPSPQRAETTGEIIHQALVEGDALRLKEAIQSMYLGGVGLAALFDGPIRAAMHEIGERWKHDAQGILVEHRATDLCIEAISRLRELIAPAAPTAPLAIGGAPPGDLYLLPSLMASVVLADAGYRVINLGPDTPLHVLQAAAEEQKATLAWLSISSIAQKAQLERDVCRMAEDLEQHHIRMVVGGRLAPELSIRSVSGLHTLGTMSDLAAFARGAR
jgi:MerR family transcriptional regulator, light-induced transcriptional regulator